MHLPLIIFTFISLTDCHEAIDSFFQMPPDEIFPKTSCEFKQFRSTIECIISCMRQRKCNAVTMVRISDGALCGFCYTDKPYINMMQKPWNIPTTVAAVRTYLISIIIFN